MCRARTLASWLIAALCGVALVAFTAGLAGCGATPDTELTAADALIAAANAVETGTAEYHGEIAGADQARRDAVLEALAERVAREPAQAAGHLVAARAALERVDADARVEDLRAANLRAAAAVLREMAARLRELALSRLAMTDRARELVEPYVVGPAPGVAPPIGPSGPAAPSPGSAGYDVVLDGPPAAPVGP